MTDTLPTRLRNRAYRLATRDLNGDGANLAIEAAKRIEELEAELAKPKPYSPYDKDGRFVP